MSTRNLDDLIETVDDVIEAISEQELHDADIVLAREVAEQLKEELTSLQHADDE